MGTIHFTVSNRTFKTVAAPDSVEPGFYSEPVEIHVARNHGKEPGSYDRLHPWNVAYDRACDLHIGREVLFVDYQRKTDLTKYYRSDTECRADLFIRHGEATDNIPVFKTDGGSEAWAEELDRAPVGYLVPWNGNVNSDGDVLSDPDGRGQWIYVPFKR
jgi:hypothetical protein